MSFQETSKNINLVDDHILSASCQGEDGSWQDSSIDLDHFLGNNDGSFNWDGKDFSQSAGGAIIQEHEGKLSLVCVLRQNNYEWKEASIDLSDRIYNSNGNLVYLP
ncbi:MAG: Cyanovirin-N [Benniella sp.]|nr:MAG: Cyanovirin-N [Benniella sp.]